MEAKKNDGATVKEIELQNYLAELDEIEQIAAPFLAQSEQQFYWKPGEDRWSCAEIFVHISRFNRPYFMQIKTAIDRARERGMTGTGPFKHDLYSRWLAGMMEPPGRIRLKTPRVFAPKTHKPERMETIEASRKDRIALRFLIESADGLHLARVKVVSPITRLMRFSLGQCFRMLIGHEKRHLQQMSRLRQHPDFPGD